MKHSVKIISVLILLIIALVFSNSFKNEEASHGISNTVADMIEPILAQVMDTEGLDVNQLIRKAAHLSEFAVLGILVMSLLIRVWHRYQWNLFGFGFFLVLLVAVLDEYIQTFSDRSGKVEDILLDLAGALLGFALAGVIVKIKGKIKGETT